MNVFVCRICNQPFLGPEKSPRCASCGARAGHLVPGAEYQPVPAGVLSRKTREALAKVLEGKVDSAGFHRGASKVADDEEGAALLSALARLETRQATLLCRVLEQDLPQELTETGSCSPSHKENLAESRKRLERSARLCRRIEEQVEGERVHQLLQAFAETAEDLFEGPA